MQLDVCVLMHQGDRDEQQDRAEWLLHPRVGGIALAVLADGMGGHTGGAQAAEQVIYTLRSNFDLFLPQAESAGEMLKTAALEAHTLVQTSSFVNEKNPHSTLAAMLVQPQQFTWIHCGDSRVYHYRAGQLLTRTVDHSYVEDLLANGRITLEQAAHHPQRNLLTTSVGGKDSPRLVQSAAVPQIGDAFVICSDGVWTYFSDEEIGRVLLEPSARQACEQLLEYARDRAGGQGDNLSAIVIKVI